MAGGCHNGRLQRHRTATEIARNMVTKWGLSDRLGPQTYSEDDGEVFLGRSRDEAQAGFRRHREHHRRGSAKNYQHQLRTRRPDSQRPR